MPKPIVANPFDIGIPIDLEKLLVTRLLVQAGSGGGKSYLVRKIAEMVGNKVQQIIIDPEGDFSTLREKFDFVLVSKDGDIPLNLKYAEVLAHKLLETNLSAIIDLYELKHHERILFVKRFLDAMINAPQELWHSCLVYLDEAHMFCPEKSKCESMGSVIDLCTRGRKRGFAAILATQRLAKLHKDAAAECFNKMIGRTGLDIDRKRASEELGMLDKRQILELRELEPGEFYAFGPAISNEVTKFKVGKVITTHLGAGKRIAGNVPTPDAVKKILSQLGDISVEAENELITKQDLQKEVTRLRGELTKSRTAAVKPATTTKTKDTVPDLLSQNKISELQRQLSSVQKESGQWKNLAKSFESMLDRNLSFVQERVSSIQNQSSRQQTAAATMLPKTQPRPTNNTAGGSQTANIKLPIGELKILTACAQFPNGLLRNQLTVLTAYKRSSRDAYIQRLREKSLLMQTGEKLYPTKMGVDHLGDNFEPLPTGDALQDYWLKELPQGEAAILKLLIEVYPEAVSRDELTAQSGYQRSTRDAYLQRMTAKEIIVNVPGEGIKASENLFD